MVPNGALSDNYRAACTLPKQFRTRSEGLCQVGWQGEKARKEKEHLSNK